MLLIACHGSATCAAALDLGHHHRSRIKDARDGHTLAVLYLCKAEYAHTIHPPMITCRMARSRERRLTQADRSTAGSLQSSIVSARSDRLLASARGPLSASTRAAEGDELLLQWFMLAAVGTQAGYGCANITENTQHAE